MIARQTNNLILISMIFLCIATFNTALAVTEILVDGTSFDSWTALESEWNYYYPWGQTHNGSAKMYISQLSLSNGELTITAETPDPESDYNYRSGAIHLKETIHISDQWPEWSVYGEFRAPYLTGTWPAFWITHAGAWTHECDILEFKGDRDNWFNTYDGGWETNTVWVADNLEVWHSYELKTYKLNDTDVTTEYYLDGVLKGTHTLSGGMGKYFWLIINLQMEGSSGSPGPTQPTYYYARNVTVTRTEGIPPAGAPSEPTDLVVFGENNRIHLTWTNSPEWDTDHYNIYRSTTPGGPYDLVADAAPGSDYYDTGLSNGTTYYYVISAVDRDGNESILSGEASATPEALVLLSQGQPVTASSYEGWNEPFDGNDGNLSTRWTASDGTYPQWWRVDLGSIQPISQVVTYWYGGSGRSYQYLIEISDDDVNYTTVVDQTTRTETGTSTDVTSASARYLRVTVTGSTTGWAAFYECKVFGPAGETTPPAAPTGLAALPGDGSVSLEWADNTEPDLASYNVKRATITGGPYTTIAVDVASSDYVDNTVTNGTTYYYLVSAVDTSCNEGPSSSEASGTPIDTTPPAAPVNLVADADDSSVSLDWNDSSEPDLAGYNVYRSTVSGGPYSQIATDVSTSDYVDNTVTNGTTYYYVVTAIDTSSNESGESSEASATPASLLSQGQPVTASSYESGNEPFDGNDGNLSTRWTASSSNYPEWWRVDLGSVQSITQVVTYWYGDTSRSYKYRIEISDDDVNYTTVVDQTARTETGTSTDLFSASARYVRVTVTGVSPSGGWAAFWECQVFGISGGDTIPPAAPTGLTATAGDGSVSLDWADNTEPDLANYSVYRSTTSGSGYASIATGIATSDYVDNTAVNGMTYYYVVTAVDTSSNESGYSNEASATPVDTPPAAPTNLTATGGDSQVSLDWDDNTEPDLMHYDVYRSTTSGSGYVSIGSGVVISDYVDNSVTNGTTYYYVVTAVDTASNESGYSNEASATPDVVADIIDTANADIVVQGSVSGSYADTQTSDNLYESITEVRQGNPRKGFSSLEHKWTINVTGGDIVTFYVEAFQTVSSDGDNFIFAYSTDDSTYTNMLTVTKTSDDNTYQSCVLPASLSGTVYIRVLDTDSTEGNQAMDTLYVDHLYIVSAGGEPDTTPPSPDPMTWATLPYSTGSTSIAMVATTASDPSGVEYYFTCTAGGGHDSGWQSSPSYEDTGLSPETGYTYTVKARDLSSNLNETAASTAESATTDPAGAEPDMYVNDIAMGSRNAGSNYFGQATVWIKDDTGANVEGATVYGNWSDATSESVSGTTLADGIVFFESSKVKNGGTYTFTVADVVKSGYVYNATLNVETTDSITAP